MLFWPLKHFEGISRPAEGGGRGLLAVRVGIKTGLPEAFAKKNALRRTQQSRVQICKLLQKTHSNRAETQTHAGKDVVCDSNSSPETYCELPRRQYVCSYSIPLCSKVKAQGIYKYAELDVHVISNDQRLIRLGIMYRHSVQKNSLLLACKENRHE